MIIIKNIILHVYFILITHTDDFPSTGTRLGILSVLPMKLLYTILILKTLYELNLR